MMIQGIHKGRTMKEVSFLDTNNDADEVLVRAAMHATGETPSSLFGHSVKRYPEEATAIVTLHTD